MSKDTVYTYVNSLGKKYYLNMTERKETYNGNVIRRYFFTLKLRRKTSCNQLPQDYMIIEPSFNHSPVVTKKSKNQSQAHTNPNAS